MMFFAVSQDHSWVWSWCCWWRWSWWWSWWCWWSWWWCSKHHHEPRSQLGVLSRSWKPWVTQGWARPPRVDSFSGQLRTSWFLVRWCWFRLKMLTWGSSIFARVQSKNCNLEKSGSSFGSRPEKHQPGAETQEHQQTAIKVVDVTCAVPKHQGGREKNWKIHPHGPENGTCCLKKKNSCAR